jgi:hypothetical protein
VHEICDVEAGGCATIFVSDRELARRRRRGARGGHAAGAVGGNAELVLAPHHRGPAPSSRVVLRQLYLQPKPARNQQNASKQASRQAISLYYSPLGIINVIFYPEAAPGGAAVAADAVDPEDVAARVHLHVVALGRRADLDPGVVQAALRGKTSPQSGHAKKSILKAKVDHHHLPGRCEEPDAAEAQVDDGAKEPAVAADVMPPQRREVLRHTPSSVARELAAHLEDAGGARAPHHRQRKEEDEEHREEAGSAAGRRRHRSDRALGWHSIEAANR